jgi:hypothetical protein
MSRNAGSGRIFTQRSAGRGLSPAERGLRLLTPDIPASKGSRATRAGDIRHGAEPTLRCLGSSDRPFGQTTRPRLKRASGPHQWDSVLRTEPERRSGSRTHDTMLIRHLLYPSELSSLERSTGFEPIPPGFPGALPKSYDRVSDWRNTPVHGTARLPGFNEPEHKAKRRRGCMKQSKVARKQKNAPLFRLPIAAAHCTNQLFAVAYRARLLR